MIRFLNIVICLFFVVMLNAQLRFPKSERIDISKMNIIYSHSIVHPYYQQSGKTMKSCRLAINILNMMITIISVLIL